MIWQILVSKRSEKTNRWLKYRWHDTAMSLKSAQKMQDEILNQNPCNTIRVKLKLIP